MAARCVSADLDTASERAMSAESAGVSAAGLAANSAASRRAWPRSAGSSAPESSQGSRDGRGGGVASAVSAMSAVSACSAVRAGCRRPVTGASDPSRLTGASSRITCALVPPIPNADTPARRGRSDDDGQGRAAVSSSTRPDDQSTCGDGDSACSVAGSSACRMACTILMTPATPAAAWVCPRLDLTEPSQSGGCSGARSCPYVASSAPASIGSPSFVPVPCPSTTSTSPPRSPASASARAMSCR